MTLTPNSYKTRLIEKELTESLGAFGGVSIEGPKWCGKTWVGLNVSNSAYMIGDTNEYGQSYKGLAENNILLAMSGKPPHLIDEWQDVPKIWDAVRSDIDRNSYKGRYILTGSSTPKENKNVHSGTGRIRHIDMRTMSLLESDDSTGSVSLYDIICGNDIGVNEEHTTLETLVELAIGGGWPGNMNMSFKNKEKSVKGYLESIIADASMMDGVRRNKSNVWLVMKSLARNECTLATNKKICNDTGIPLTSDGKLMLPESENVERPPVSYDTVTDYLDVFDRLHLITNQNAFSPNIKSSVRVGKTKKRHLVDPSLAIAAIGASKERLMNDLTTFGFMFESLCERDLDIYAKYLGGSLYHYRDENGREVDAIVELPNGTWGAFEIKLGAAQIEDASKELIEFKEFMHKNEVKNEPKSLCVICGLTEYAYRRDDGVYVVPITSLRP